MDIKNLQKNKKCFDYTIKRYPEDDTKKLSSISKKKKFSLVAAIQHIGNTKKMTAEFFYILVRRNKSLINNLQLGYKNS